MACQGSCKVQLFDVDVSDIKVQVVQVAPDGKTAPSGPQYGCPDLSLDEQADKLQPPFVKIEGCKDNDCVCVPTDNNPQWTDWLTYNANAEITQPNTTNPNYTCKYTLTGTYIVSSAVVDGVCMNKPAVPLPRPRSSKPKPKKVDRGGLKTGGPRTSDGSKKPRRKKNAARV